MRYDRDGDQHYDVISAFIKCIRGSDADAALHYLARMIEAGEDPRFIARRLIVHASEDVGLADPTALQTAVAAAQAVEFVGLPEARINLAQATIHLALAPKSNAVIKAIGAADAGRAGRAGRARCPPTCATRTTRGDAARPRRGYVYPHDDARASSRSSTRPTWWPAATYYQPTRHGAEARYADRASGSRRSWRAPRRRRAELEACRRWRNGTR